MSPQVNPRQVASVVDVMVHAALTVAVTEILAAVAALMPAVPVATPQYVADEMAE